MISKCCIICCKEKIKIQEKNSQPVTLAEDDNYQKKGERNMNATSQMQFFLSKLLEIPEYTCQKLIHHFGNSDLWIECCESCSPVVDKCKATLKQVDSLQKEYEELRSNIKTTMLKSQKTLKFESKCEAIVRSHVITREIENFINVHPTVTETEEITDGNIYFDSSSLPAVIGCNTHFFFENISKAKNENDNMDGILESSDILKSNQTAKYMDISKVDYGKSNPSETDNLNVHSGDSSSSDDLKDQLELSAKSNRTLQVGNYSVNTANQNNAPESESDTAKKHSDRKHECHLCLQLFKLSQDLKVHLLTHSRRRSSNVMYYECDICGKRLKGVRILKLHYKRHSGERPFKCDICGKSFADKGNLKEHHMRHTGERPYECNICGKSFVHDRMLKQSRQSRGFDVQLCCV